VCMKKGGLASGEIIGTENTVGGGGP